jgi:hypothetical protein
MLDKWTFNKYKNYSKLEIVNAINSLYREINIENYVVVSLVDSNLAREVDIMLSRLYIHNFPRKDKRVQILISAYYQLEDYGTISSN